MTNDASTLHAVLDFGVGGGVFLAGLALIIAAIALARTFGRLNKTLEVVDSQLGDIGPAAASTLQHVSGAASGAEQTVAHLATAAKSLEGAASALAQTAELSKSAVVPGVTSFGESINIVADRLKRFVGGNDPRGGNAA